MVKYVEKYAPAGTTGGDFVAKIIRGKALVYSLAVTLGDGRKAWYIFEAEKPKQQMFEQLFMTNSAFSFNDFGTVHASGWGEEPPETVKAEMHQKYGLFET